MNISKQTQTQNGLSFFTFILDSTSQFLPRFHREPDTLRVGVHKLRFGKSNKWDPLTEARKVGPDLNSEILLVHHHLMWASGHKWDVQSMQTIIWYDCYRHHSLTGMRRPPPPPPMPASPGRQEPKCRAGGSFLRPNFNDSPMHSSSYTSVGLLGMDQPTGQKTGTLQHVKLRSMVKFYTKSNYY